MNYRDAQDMAVEFGALRFTGDHTAATFDAWSDRIAYLPTAAERGADALLQAITEANIYSGWRIGRSAAPARRPSAEPLQSLAMSTKRKVFDVAGRGL